MAKGDNKNGPSGNTRKGNKKDEDHCNQVNAGTGDTANHGNTSGQASGSGQVNMGVSPGNNMTQRKQHLKCHRIREI